MSQSAFADCRRCSTLPVDRGSTPPSRLRRRSRKSSGAVRREHFTIIGSTKRSNLPRETRCARLPMGRSICRAEEMHMPGGERIEETRVALCRCGASQNKPYCDNSHVAADFHDSATHVPQQLAEGIVERTTVSVTFAPDGPVLIDGPVAVCGADASEAVGVKCALCRCGRSRAKPFCDGSHVAAGIRTDSPE